MRKGTKKAVALTCAALMTASAVGILAGCGGDDNTGNVKPIVEVEWLITKDDNTDTPITQNAVLNYWQEQTGIKVNWYDPASKAEAWAQQLLDGKYSDIVDVGLNANKSSSLLDLYDQGIIYDLKPYIEECMPNFNAMLGMVEGDITTNRMKQATDKDGNPLYNGEAENANVPAPVYAKKGDKYYTTTEENGVYTIGEEVAVDESKLTAKMVVDQSYIFLVPVVKEEPEPWGGYAYRHDMVVDVKGENFTWPSGQAAATTIEDWEFIMEAVKEYYTKHNISGAYPMYLPHEGYFSCGELIGGFGVNGAQYVDDDGVVRFGAAEQGYFDYLTQIKAWFDKGYISPDFSSQQFTYPEADDTNILTGRLGIFFATKGHLGNGFVRDGDIRALANPVKNVGDKALGLVSPAAMSHASQNEGYMITKQNTNEAKLKKILSALDWFFTEEGSRTRTMGLSSHQGAWDEAEYIKYGITNGSRKPNSSEWTDEMYEATTVAVFDVSANRMPGVEITYPKRAVDIAAGLSAGGVTPWTTYGTKNTYALNDLMNAYNISNYVAYAQQTALMTVTEQYTVQVILGQKPLTQETFNTFKEDLEAAGLSAFLKTLQEAKAN